MRTWLIVVFTSLFCCVSFLRAGAAANPRADTMPPPQEVEPSQMSNPPTPEGDNPAPTFSPLPGEAPNPGYSPEALSLKEKAVRLLNQKDFSYNPGLLRDPFVPFVKPPEPTPAAVPVVSEEEETLPPEMQRPLTPLQRMNIGEIERGLKAIVWGDLGRKALIQDSAGKGYIVAVGTPAGGSSGVITQIFNDRLVIQQQVWDKDQKKLVPRNEIISLRKQTKG